MNPASGRFRFRLIFLAVFAALVVLAGGLALIFLLPRAPALGLEMLPALQVGTEPLGMALSSDQKMLYVANAADGSISAVNLASGASRTYPVVKARLNSLAASSNGRALYVSDVEHARIYALELPSGRVRGSVQVGDFPQALLLSPDGSRLYSADTGSNTVSEVNTATLKRLSSTPVSERPFSLAYDPDGNLVVAGNLGALERIDLKSKTVSPPTSLPDLSRLLGLCIGTDGQTYVADGLSGEVLSLGARGNRKLDPGALPLGLEFSPTDVALSPDESKVYAVGRSGYLSAVSVSSQKSLGTLELGGDLRRIVVSSAGRIYASDFAGARVRVVGRR